jgi:hypothetical protein
MLADISTFENLQKDANQNMGTQLSVFNTIDGSYVELLEEKANDVVDACE